MSWLPEPASKNAPFLHPDRPHRWQTVAHDFPNLPHGYAVHKAGHYREVTPSTAGSNVRGSGRSGGTAANCRSS